MNCFGKLFLDRGQSLVPEPPHNITGNNIFLGMPKEDPKFRIKELNNYYLFYKNLQT